ncbi:LOW QUALITY PROTEIN: hypothetical protein U9M48_016979, partial [Paspalum notatum var. saurae]
HDRRRHVEQRRQRVGGELPGEEVAGGRGSRVVRAGLPAGPDAADELRRGVPRAVRHRVGAARGPVDVRHGAVRVARAVPQAHVRLHVVLVGVARRPAVPPEQRVVPGVRQDAGGHVAAELEPLRPLAPLPQRDVRRHAPAVPLAAPLGVLVVGLHEAVMGADESYTVERLCTGMQLSERSTNRSLEKSSSAFASSRFSASISDTEPHEVIANARDNLYVGLAPNLAGDLPAVERRVLGDVDRHTRRRVDVDGEVVLGATAEEALPERSQRQDAAAGEEHEGHLGHALERVPVGGRHQRGAPEQLLVGHVVHEARRSHEVREVGVRDPGKGWVAIARERGRAHGQTTPTPAIESSPSCREIDRPTDLARRARHGATDGDGVPYMMKNTRSTSLT